MIDSGKAAPNSNSFLGPTRYVRDAKPRFDALRVAAEDYPDRVKLDSGLEWMRRKPYDPTVGHPHFFATMYAVMNAIRAMQLSPNALILEVGSGPGWLTQLLIGLGYRVLAVEPSTAMNKMAEERVAAFLAMTGVETNEATFVTSTLEEAPLERYRGAVDAAIFHEALHHVIDEREALRKVFDLLRPGGCLSVCGEGRWNPGDSNLERSLDEEMARYGTLESPFTQGYLRHVLEDTGFTDVTFFHSVNGLFTQKQEKLPLREMASPSIETANTVLAWRPLMQGMPNVPSANSRPDLTSSEINVLRTHWDGSYLAVSVRLRNTGKTYWALHRPLIAAGVTLTLVQDVLSTPAPEAGNRCSLPKMVLPGEDITIDWIFDARGLDQHACRLRLIAEGAFWFEGGQSVAGPKRA